MLKIIAHIILGILIVPILTAQVNVVGPQAVVNPYLYNTTKNATVRNAAVVCAHPLAAKVGKAILLLGGNAFDAAIATQLALAVVYPQAGNIGGGGFMVARTAQGKAIALDYRETAPAAAYTNMYLDSTGKALTELSQNGHLASGVPGSIAGMYATLPYAKLPWGTLVQPAIDLAFHGFSITQTEAGNLNALHAALIKYNTQPSAFEKSTPWKAGDTLVQAQLAAVLTRVRDNGARGFYEGTTAALIVAEMQRGKGIITLTDLAKYTPKLRTPITFTYKKDYTIITMPPPSSGGILLTQMLHMLDGRLTPNIRHNSAEYIQLVTEVERRAYADRAAHLGDADFYNVPIATLISKDYAKSRMLDYIPNQAQKSSNIQAGIIGQVSEETTHISILDAQGNMVSVTTTLNGSYGSKTVVGGAGFFLNNEMDDFSIKPGVANMYGAVGGIANSIQPYKRMLSSMTPTLVLKRNKPYIVCGTPGGTTIITSVLQTILNITNFNMTAQDAVNKPKFHHQWLPDEVYVEKTIPQATIQAVTKMGYTVTPRGPIGRNEVIKIIGKNKIEIAADYRGDDAAEGY